MFGKEITEAARGVWRKKRARVRTQGPLLSFPLWCQPHLCPFQHPEMALVLSLSGRCASRQPMCLDNWKVILCLVPCYLDVAVRDSSYHNLWVLLTVSPWRNWTYEQATVRKGGWKTAIIKEGENRVRLKERRRKWFIPKSYIWPVTSVNGFYWLKGLLQQNTDIQQSCEGST